MSNAHVRSHTNLSPTQFQASGRFRVLIIVLACIGAFALGVLSPRLWEIGVSGRELFPLLGLAFLCAAPFLHQLNAGRVEIFDPIHAFSLSIALAFVVGPALMLLRGLVGVRDVSLRPELPEALFIAALGLLGAYIGSAWAGRIAARNAADGRQHGEYSVRQRRRVFFLLVATLFVSIALFVTWFVVADIPFAYLNALAADIGYTDATTSASTSLFYLWSFRRSWPLLIIACWLFAPNRFWKAIIAFAWLLNLAIYVTGANRTSVFNLLVITFIVFYLQRQKRPSLITLALLATLVLALAGGLVLSRGRVATTLDSETIVEAALEDLMDRGAATGLLQVVYTFPERAPYMGARAFSDLMAAPIPRSLWPDKPSLTPVQDLTTLYTPTMRAHAPGALGIYYAGLSYAGPIAIMALYSLLTGWIFQMWRRDPENPFLQLFLAGCPTTIWTLLHRGPPTFALILLAYNFGPVFLIWWASRSQAGRSIPSMAPAT